MRPPAERRDLVGAQSSLSLATLDSTERSRVSWTVAAELGVLIDQVLEQGVDVTTLQVDARRDPAVRDGLLLRVSARAVPLQLP